MTTVSTTRTWDRIEKFGHDEHRLFMTSNGRWAIADRSGSKPEFTDDGILWIDLNRSLEFDFSEFAKSGMRVWVPLICDRTGEKSSTFSCLKLGRFLMNELHMEYKMSERLLELEFLFYPRNLINNYVRE